MLKLRLSSSSSKKTAVVEAQSSDTLASLATHTSKLDLKGDLSGAIACASFRKDAVSLSLGEDGKSSLAELEIISGSTVSFSVIVDRAKPTDQVVEGKFKGLSIAKAFRAIKSSKVANDKKALAIEFVAQHAKAVVSSETFFHLSASALATFLEYDTLCLSEVALLEALISWGERRVKGDKKGDSKDSKQTEADTETVAKAVKDLISPLLSLIRFPTLSMAELSQLANRGLLAQEELLQLFMFTSLPEGKARDSHPVAKLYNTKRRSGLINLAGWSFDPSVNSGKVIFSEGNKVVVKPSHGPDVICAIGDKGMTKGKWAWNFKVHTYRDEMWLGVIADDPSLALTVTGDAIRYHQKFWLYKDGSRGDNNRFHAGGQGGSHTPPGKYKTGDNVGIYLNLDKKVPEMSLYLNHVFQSKAPLPADSTFWPFAGLDGTADKIEVTADEKLVAAIMVHGLDN